MFLFFVLGLIIGSFLNVVILRLPVGETLAGRSHCPNCHRILAPLDLVPLFSYLFLKGKCRGCKSKISPRYAIIELLTGAVFALGWYSISPQNLVEYIELARVLFAVSILLVVFVVDLEHYLILDKVVLPAVIVVFAFNVALDVIKHISIGNIYSFTLGGLIGAGVFFGICFLIWLISKGKWIGFGDVKFMLFMGSVLGFPLAILGFFLSFILGAVTSIPMLILGQKSLQSKLPLGTFLSIATFITIFYGKYILDWYLGLLGF